MKANTLLTVAIVLIPAISFAQSNNLQQEKFKPTKGYYAIHNNADKLLPTDKNTVAVTDVLEAKKGYFAIGKNKQQVKQVGLPNTEVKPKVTKGYYAIGKNADKL